MESLEFGINFRSIRYINNMKHLFKFSKRAKPWLFPLCEFIMAVSLFGLCWDAYYNKSVYFMFFHSFLFFAALKIDFLYLGQFIKYLQTIPKRSNLRYHFQKDHFKVFVMEKRKIITTHTITYNNVESVLETPLSLQIRCFLPDAKRSTLSTAIFKSDFTTEELNFLIQLFKDEEVTYFDFSSIDNDECTSE